MESLRNILWLVVVLFVMYEKTAASDFLSPLLSPIIDDVCKEVECGKGKCNPSSNSSFMFECVCEDGWKQMDLHLKFLPCVIPNCTLDMECGEAPPRAQTKPPNPSNHSFLDPCLWTDCGGGLCNKTSAFTYTCECQEGYKNLLNVSAFPCFKQCALGIDCENLGIPLSDNTSASPPAMSDRSKNQGTGVDPRRTSSVWITSAICITVTAVSLMLL